MVPVFQGERAHGGGPLDCGGGRGHDPCGGVVERMPRLAAWCARERAVKTGVSRENAPKGVPMPERGGRSGGGWAAAEVARD